MVQFEVEFELVQPEVRLLTGKESDSTGFRNKKEKERWLNETEQFALIWWTTLGSRRENGCASLNESYIICSSLI